MPHGGGVAVVVDVSQIT